MGGARIGKNGAVPVGYLTTVILIALGTLFALAPPRRPIPLAKVGFRVGLVVNEVPLLACLLLFAATALAVGDGEIRSTAGWAVVAVAAMTALGLAVVARRALLARPAVEAALTDGLGAAWRSAIDPEIAAGLGRGPSLARIALWPFPWFPRPGAVERIPNLSYGDAGRRNLLDVYRHRSHPRGAPTLVYLHGGGYGSGRKEREGRPLIHRLASHRWVCVSANYRLRPAATFPDHLADLRRVIAWVREHGAEYGADPDLMFVAGSSAGGHLAALAALTDTSVVAAICVYGYLGNYYGLGAESSPGAYVRSDAPPFLVVQGDRDTYSPRFVEIARDFADTLRDASSNPVIYAELPGAQHAFDVVHSIREEAVVDGIEAFAAWVRSTRPMDPT